MNLITNRCLVNISKFQEMMLSVFDVNFLIMNKKKHIKYLAMLYGFQSVQLWLVTLIVMLTVIVCCY